MRNIICSIKGHKPKVTKTKVYCLRCKKLGFMERITKKKHGEIQEFGFEDNPIEYEKTARAFAEAMGVSKVDNKNQ